MTVDWVTPVVAAAGGLVVGWVAHYLWSHPTTRPRPVPPSATDLVRRAPPESAPPTVPPNTTTAPATGSAARVGASGLARSEPSSLAPPAGPGGEGLTLARQVILHLARVGRVGAEDVAPLGSTQQGMVAALHVRQGSLVRVLQRLRAANVVEVDRRHVAGVPRRLLVYRLTSLGESIARDLRHPTPPRPPSVPAPSGAWIAPRTPTAEQRV